MALTFTVVAAIITESTLRSSASASPGRASTTWGNLRPARRSRPTGNWWLVVFPVLVLLLTVLAINFIGDGCGTPSTRSRPRNEPDGDTGLEVRDLQVSFPPRTVVQAVRGVDLDVNEGELVGVVGESGLGQVGDVPRRDGPAAEVGPDPGSATVRGQSSSGVARRSSARCGGKRIAMIFQDPLSALNPVHKVGDQIAEMIQSTRDVNDKRPSRAVELLDMVGIPQPSTGRGSTRTSSPAACASGR